MNPAEMSARQGARNYTPDPSVAQVAHADEGWTLIVEARASIVELCLLMNRFNCTAVMLDSDRLELRPKDRNAPTPRGEDVITLLERGLDGTPRMLKVQAT